MFVNFFLNSEPFFVIKQFQKVKPLNIFPTKWFFKTYRKTNTINFYFHFHFPHSYQTSSLTQVKSWYMGLLWAICLLQSFHLQIQLRIFFQTWSGKKAKSYDKGFLVWFCLLNLCLFRMTRGFFHFSTLRVRNFSATNQEVKIVGY